MIERYSRKVMRDIWTEESKFNAYLKVEISNFLDFDPSNT